MKNSHAALAVFFSLLMLSPVAYGFNITIDATEVDTSINIGFGDIPVHGTETYDLSTGITYSVFSNPGGYDICSFWVNENGTVGYDETKYGGRVQGIGTSTLTIPGHSITLDGTNVDTDLQISILGGIGKTNYGGSFTYRLPANDPNTPGYGYAVFSNPGGYDICSFWVNENGTVGYDETKYGGRVQGIGTSTLTIPGHSITLDGTNVDTDLQISILGGIGKTNYGGSFTYRLPANDPNTPGYGYAVFSNPGGYDICSFWVNENGTVGYDETKYGGRVQGIGTSTLTIPGHSITLDGTNVDTDLQISILGGIGKTNYGGSFTYRLPANDPNTPGYGYAVFSNPGGYDICSFWVNENGTVGYDETKYGGRVQGIGTSTLTIPGHSITLDGTNVDTDLQISILGGIGKTNYGGSFTYRLPANDPNTPGYGYAVFSNPGGYDICSFWVNENGTVGYDETKYGGRVQGIGTSTLTIPGHSITLDGTNVDTDLQISILGGIGKTNYGGSFTYRLPANDPNTPGYGYAVFSNPGGYVLDRFTVNPDGLVTYDPSLDGVTVTGLGTNVLQIIGHPVLLDATEVSANVAVNGLSYTYASETGLYFLPPNHFSSPYLLYSNPGGPVTDGEFNINDFGSCSINEVTYDYGTIRLYCGSYNPDSEPPPTSNVVANPNPVEFSNDINLMGTVDDTQTGGSNIASAEYSIDGGAWIPMVAQDGAFDSPTENVTVTLPAFTIPEVYQICVRGTDDADNEGLGECIFIAVYDPDGGFVTGGGWIMSPAGAYSEDPSLEGKANFGFVSKYKKGATVPTGNTEFQFKAGDLNFHSDEYDWLVVPGDHTAKYKGIGTIDGVGSYKFMIWAQDLEPDTFRIKIWEEDEDESEFVIYDNGFDQEIGGGNIKVHEGN